MAKCSGECRFEKVWVDRLRDFETWTVDWYTREIHTNRGVSGPGKAALRAHVESLNVGRWTKQCAAGCKCDGKWQKETTTTIPLRIGDGVHGAIALCTGTLHRREYIGTCKDKKRG